MKTNKALKTKKLQADIERLQLKNADPKRMLETLHMAYQHVLDNMDRCYVGAGVEVSIMKPDGQLAPGYYKSRKRLTEKQERELGRRLADYWLIKTL